MYTSTPQSPLPFSLLHHFLPLTSFLPVSPSARFPLIILFSILFPSIILSSPPPPPPPPLPCHFYLHLLPLSPLFPLLHPPSLLLSFFLSSLPFAPYHSIPSLLLLSPFSLEILQLYLLPVRRSPSFLLSIKGYFRCRVSIDISTAPFFYKASSVPHHLRVPLEVQTPTAHHRMCPLRGTCVARPLHLQ